jgi:hypothetical protein
VQHEIAKRIMSNDNNDNVASRTLAWSPDVNAAVIATAAGK